MLYYVYVCQNGKSVTKYIGLKESAEKYWDELSNNYINNLLESGIDFDIFRNESEETKFIELSSADQILKIVLSNSKPKIN